MRGQGDRREADAVMCRVPIAALSQVRDLRRPMRVGEYVDLSCQSVSRPLISEWDRVDSVVSLLPVLGHAEKVQEVLVAWRGGIDRRVFEVVNPDTAEFVRMLDPSVQSLEMEPLAVDIGGSID